jgi:hypothetical protein
LLEKHLAGAAASGGRTTCKIRLRGPNVVHARLDANHLPSPAARRLIVLTDITERKHRVQALERA